MELQPEHRVTSQRTTTSERGKPYYWSECFTCSCGAQLEGNSDTWKLFEWQFERRKFVAQHGEAQPLTA